MKDKAKHLYIFFYAIFFLSVAGCATIEGAGKDIEAAGEAVQDAANSE